MIICLAACLAWPISPLVTREPEESPRLTQQAYSSRRRPTSGSGGTGVLNAWSISNVSGDVYVNSFLIANGWPSELHAGDTIRVDYFKGQGCTISTTGVWAWNNSASSTISINLYPGASGSLSLPPDGDTKLYSQQFQWESGTLVISTTHDKAWPEGDSPLRVRRHKGGRTTLAGSGTDYRCMPGSYNDLSNFKVDVATYLDTVTLYYDSSPLTPVASQGHGISVGSDASGQPSVVYSSGPIRHSPSLDQGGVDKAGRLAKLHTKHL